MKAGHVVVRLRSGAGDTPWRRRTFPAVWSETSHWPTRPHNPVIAPGAVLFGHEDNQFLNCPVDPGSPGLRCFEPSNLRATSLRYHPRLVSGRAAVATSPSALRPSLTTNLAELRSLGVRE